MSEIDQLDSMTSEFESGVIQPPREEPWMKAYWRPALAWNYLVTCSFDFIIFPVIWSVFQAYHGGSVIIPWAPLTLQGGGLFHIAMGAAIGIAAYSRGQEKLNDKL